MSQNILQSVCVCVHGDEGALLEELGVLGLLPVQQVLQVVDEGSLPQDTSLGQNCTQTQEDTCSSQLVCSGATLQSAQ